MEAEILYSENSQPFYIRWDPGDNDRFSGNIRGAGEGSENIEKRVNSEVSGRGGGPGGMRKKLKNKEDPLRNRGLLRKTEERSQ